MANEIIPVDEQGRPIGYVLGEAEATYGVDPAPDISNNLMSFETFEAELDEAVIDRNPISPEGPGSKPVLGRTLLNVSLASEVVLPTVSAGDTTDMPAVHPVLHAAQWTRTGDNTDNTQTYVKRSFSAQGSTFYRHELDEGDTDTNLTKCIGTVLSSSLRWSEGELLLLSGEGMALGYDEPDDVLSNPGSGLSAMTYPADNPEVGYGAVVKIVNLSDDSLYGGGSLASPNNDLVLTDFSFEDGSVVVPKGGLSPTSGVKRLRSRRTGPATISLSLDATLYSSFDPYTLKNSRQALEINITFGAPSGGNWLQFLAYGVITDIAKQAGEDGVMYDLTIRCIYPEDSTDGDPAAGRSPTQVFNAGTNQGLRLDPTATLPRGIAVLQFGTT